MQRSLDTYAEAIEFRVLDSSGAANVPIRDLAFPKEALIGTIIRGKEIFIPSGDDEMRPGDEVIVFTPPSVIAEVEHFFQ